MRLGFAALAVAGLAGVVAVESAPPDPRPTFEAALVAGAVRLAALQRPDGTWPTHGVAGAGDLASAGRPARALLAADGVLHDRRLSTAADRTAAALGRALGSVPAASTTSNLLFLAEHARVRRDAARLAVVARAWRARLRRAGLEAPDAAAHELATRPAAAPWERAAWENYLLWQGGEAADLARALDDDAWANAFTLAMARAHAPRRHHAWSTLGAGRMLDALSRVGGPAASRLAQVHRGALREDELAPGLPWNDTPHDSWVRVSEAASAVHGLLASPEPGDREAARQGLALLALRQASTGGWAGTVSLLDHAVDPASHDFVPDARLGLDESATTNADVVLALARAL